MSQRTVLSRSLERVLPGRLFGQPVRRADAILVINGHPDPGAHRFCARLCDAYIEGAGLSGGPVRRLDIGTLDSAAKGVAEIRKADRLMVIYPSRQDRPPEALVRLFEQARYLDLAATLQCPFRAVATMEMPAFAHRALLQDGGAAKEFCRHLSLPGLDSSNLLLIGSIKTISTVQRLHWLQIMRDCGEQDSGARHSFARTGQRFHA